MMIALSLAKFEEGITNEDAAMAKENKGKVIVALLPDSGDRYYSTALFTE